MSLALRCHAPLRNASVTPPASVNATGFERVSTARKKTKYVSLEPGYSEGAGSLLLLAAATETGLPIMWMDIASPFTARCSFPED